MFSWIKALFGVRKPLHEKDFEKEIEQRKKRETSKSVYEPVSKYQSSYTPQPARYQDTFHMSPMGYLHGQDYSASDSSSHSGICSDSGSSSDFGSSCDSGSSFDGGGGSCGD